VTPRLGLLVAAEKRGRERRQGGRSKREGTRDKPKTFLSFSLSVSLIYSGGARSYI